VKILQNLAYCPSHQTSCFLMLGFPTHRYCFSNMHFFPNSHEGSKTLSADDTAARWKSRSLPIYPKPWFIYLFQGFFVPFKFQYSVFSIRYSVFNIQYSVFDIRYSKNLNFKQKPSNPGLLRWHSNILYPPAWLYYS